MINNKPADNKFPIHDLIKNRWSPLGLDPDREVSKDKIFSLLEAAHWAPSAFNEQPWSYIVGYKGDKTHEKLADCLAEGNSWAEDAPVLMLSVAKTFFDRNGKANRHHLHDTGAASGFMHLQATYLDLFYHQMAGFDLDKAREHFQISEKFLPGSMIAIAYQLEDKSALPKALADRENAPRQRKDFDQMFWENVPKNE